MNETTGDYRWPLQRFNKGHRRHARADEWVSCRLELTDESKLLNLLNTLGKSNAEPFRGAAPGTIRVANIWLQRLSSDTAKGCSLGITMNFACVTPLLHRDITPAPFDLLDRLLDSQEQRESISSR